MVALPDFAVGAMENWGLILYRENNMWYDENSTTSRTLENILTVTIHEISHFVRQ